MKPESFDTNTFYGYNRGNRAAFLYNEEFYLVIFLDRVVHLCKMYALCNFILP